MIKKPVFIVGLYRTGSTLVKNMLDLNSKIAMIPEEVHIWDPYPWTNVILGYCKKLNMSRENDRIRLVRALFSKKFDGFWKKIDEYPIKENNILNELKNIDKIDINYIDVINLIFEEYIKNIDKERLGIKYPIHITKINLLREWYPDCNIIHLTRDPRAIYSSKSNDESSRSVKARFPHLSLPLDLFTLFRIIFEYNFSKKIHLKHRDKEHYYLLRYEDLVYNPMETVKDLCEFLDISFEHAMLYAYGKPSSHTKKTKKGFDPQRAETWKKRIKYWEKMLIEIFTNESMKIFGYRTDKND